MQLKVRRILLWVGFLALLAVSPSVSPCPVHGGSPGGLLVVAPERSHGALAGYLRHKQGQMSAELLSLEKVLREAPGADDPERLKRRLYDDRKSRGTRYVLLVGDADIIPVRYMVFDPPLPRGIRGCSVL